VQSPDARVRKLETSRQLEHRHIGDFFVTLVAERFGKKENVLEYFSSRRLLLNSGHYNLLSYWSCSVINDRTKSTLCNKTPQSTIDTPIQKQKALHRRIAASAFALLGRRRCLHTDDEQPLCHSKNPASLIISTGSRA
jgi:hypothetical protein